MRRPRDLDAELKALADKERTLKERKVRQLSELVAATGADALDVETLAGGLLAMIEADDPARRESWRKRGQVFFQRRHASLHAALVAAALALKRAATARHRHEASQARHDKRAWVVSRRERTRHLIEMGGLVVKAGLDTLANDDRAVLYGAF